MYVGKSYLFFFGLDWVHFEPCEGEKKGERRREGKEEFLKRRRVRPRLGYRRWGGRELSLSLFQPPLTLPKRNGAFVFYPTAWLSGCPSVCPSVQLGWLASKLVLRRYCTRIGQRLWFQHGFLGSAFLFCWAYVLDCLSLYLCAS